MSTNDSGGWSNVFKVEFNCSRTWKKTAESRNEPGNKVKEEAKKIAKTSGPRLAKEMRRNSRLDKGDEIIPNSAVWWRELGLSKGGKIPDTELTQKTEELRASRCAAVQKVTWFHQVNQTCFLCLEELQNGYNTAQEVVDPLNYRKD